MRPRTPRNADDRRMRRNSLALTGMALATGALATAYDSRWHLGIGVWFLIAAILIELIHQP
ncbi:hypothetical protein ACIBBB_25375 [Streptomyces sp. NPDC051217]|uniref:hypothetical protein n=1 Tax=Streptomyces sp. NPDC051217 TaxID=3365644 RepID=UPI00378850F3